MQVSVRAETLDPCQLGARPQLCNTFHLTFSCKKKPHPVQSRGHAGMDGVQAEARMTRLDKRRTVSNLKHLDALTPGILAQLKGDSLAGVEHAEGRGRREPGATHIVLPCGTRGPLLEV